MIASQALGQYYFASPRVALPYQVANPIAAPVMPARDLELEAELTAMGGDLLKRLLGKAENLLNNLPNPQPIPVPAY